MDAVNIMTDRRLADTVEWALLVRNSAAPANVFVISVFRSIDLRLGDNNIKNTNVYYYGAIENKKCCALHKPDTQIVQTIQM